MVYFAYGSNLFSPQMRRRCPESKRTGIGALRGYKLLFRSHNGKTGYLTIEKDEAAMVPVGIYDISESDMETLDRHEGVHSNAYRKEELEVMFNGGIIKGLAYIMNNGVPLLPKQDYYDKVKQGYADHGFDLDTLINAYQECKQRLQAEMRE